MWSGKYTLTTCTSVGTLVRRREGPYDALPPGTTRTLSCKHQVRRVWVAEMKAINPLETTARDLQSALSSGAITSVEIVNVYLAQIERHNDWLRAVLQVAPKHFLLERAGTLDKERQEGLLRGPLHGIPVLVKVMICVDLLGNIS